MKAKIRATATKATRNTAAKTVVTGDNARVVAKVDDDPSIGPALRSRLVDLVDELSPVELVAVISFIESMEDVEDAAYIAMHKNDDDEGAISLDDLITKYGYTRDELEAEARAEGLIK